jgi:glycosyltransferase involved in cell wall biosynthesis
MSFRQLMVIAVPPALTGSGMVVKHLIREQLKANDDVYLLSAGYEPLDARSVGLDDAHVDTVLFTDPTTIPTLSYPRVSFPVPTFSSGMPFPHVRYCDLTLGQLLEFMDAFQRHLAAMIHRVRPQVIHSHHLFLLNTMIRTIAPHIPLVSQAHGTELRMLKEDRSLLPLVAPAVRSADRLLTVSESVKEQVITIYGASAQRIVNAGNGVDKEVFRRRDIDRASVLRGIGITGNQPYTVLYVGKFSAWKGISYLIGAASLCRSALGPGTVLTLVAGGGSADARSSYLEMIEARGLAEDAKLVDLYGDKQDAIASLMSIADVFVLPSIEEPLGMVLLEAMACGCRVIAAGRGGPKEVVPPDLISDGLAFLVDPIRLEPNGSVDECDIHPYEQRLADAIIAALTTEIDLAGRERLRACVPGWDTVCRTVRRTYQGAMGLGEVVD